MRSRWFLITFACVLFTGPAGYGAEPAAAPAATRASGDATIRVQSARVARSPQPMQKLFPQRYYNDGTANVSIQLLLSVKDAAVLPLARDAIALETFVDDTYQNLIADPNEFRQGNDRAPVVSEDGGHVLFTVGSNRALADDATRVFVRGALHARLARGEPKVGAAELSLTVGQQVQIGPFQATLKSISDSGRGMTVTLAVTGDVARVRKVRALSKDNRPLNEDRETTRFVDQATTDTGTPERPAMLHINIPPAQEKLTVEFTYAEKVEDVRVPFEVQVDLGVVKAGPMEPGARKAGAKPGSDARSERPWPPPPVGRDAQSFAPRRAPFDPSTRPARGADAAAGDAPASPKLEKSAVDVFSLTVAKPAPGEVDGVTWANPPSAAFRAAALTVARLMLSTPDATILSIPVDGVSVSRFSDDKGNQLDTTLYRDGGTAASFGRSQSMFLSPDGQQALMTIALASAPRPGATRCTIAGSVRAKIARGERTESADAVPLVKGQSFKIGPFTGEFGPIHQPPPLTPVDRAVSQVQSWIHLKGPTGRLRWLELLDADGNAIGGRRDLGRSSDEHPETDNVNFGVHVPGTVERVIVRIRYFDKTETVEIPFDISAGIGL